ncbi:MAG: EutN/CcmL family microcompartment protein [Chloroflexota bacterium]
MIIAKVIGNIVSTMKHPAYQGHKLFLVQPMMLGEQHEDDAFVAVDRVRAGIGDTVLVLREGSGARQILADDTAPIISIIVGILDGMEIKDVT